MHLIANLDEHPALHGYSIGICGYTDGNGREYAILGCFYGTAFVDITDSANVHEVGFLNGIGSDWRDIKVWSHYAYIVGYEPGCALQIVDLRYLPDSIHYVKTYSLPGFESAHTLEQSGPYLYVNGFSYLNGGLFILDLSLDPENPVKRGEWQDLNVHDCRVINDTIWSCNGYAGTISVISAVNKDNLFTIASWQNGMNPVAHNCARTADRNYLFTTDETFDPPGRLKIWDIRDLQNTVFVRSWNPPGVDSSVVHNVEIIGSYSVMSYYSAGIRIADISDPHNPVEAGYFDTYPESNDNSWNGCKGIYIMPSGKIIANDKQRGLFVVRTHFTIIDIQNTSLSTSVSGFSLSQNYPNPFNPVTNIKFDLPKSGYVKIKIFDIQGREIAQLVNQQMQPGSYTVDWDAANYPSGVYFYRIEAGDYKESKRMVLVK